MKILSAATLIVITSVQGCKTDSIDKANVQQIHFESAQECEEAAATMDQKIGLRAVCFAPTTGDEG